MERLLVCLACRDRLLERCRLKNVYGHRDLRLDKQLLPTNNIRYFEFSISLLQLVQFFFLQDRIPPEDVNNSLFKSRRRIKTITDTGQFQRTSG